MAASGEQQEASTRKPSGDDDKTESVAVWMRSPIRTLTQPLLPTPSPIVPLDLPTTEDLKNYSVEALVAARGQASAAEALGEATWTLDQNVVQVQTNLSKTMLPVIINLEAEKIIRNMIRIQAGTEWRVVLMSGSAQGNSGAKKKTRSAVEGSAQANAENHPVVQEAQRLFGAEIRNVIDLSDGD